MSADAVTKVAESLSELGLPSGQRERMSRIVLNAVGYDALIAERDRYREALASIRTRCRDGDRRTDWLPIIDSIARAALDPEHTQESR